jgi:hypothetical protein
MGQEKLTSEENNMQMTLEQLQVLVVASPNDQQIGEQIATALQMSGMSTRVDTTGIVASRANEFPICIIILRPDQWRTTLAITMAMSFNAYCMIPVLAEPMTLPGGAWSTEVVSLKEPLSETVQELELLIRRQFHLPSKGTKGQKKQARNDFRQQNVSPTFRTINDTTTRRRSSSVVKYVLLCILLVLIAGLPVYYALSKRSVTNPLQKTALNNALENVQSVNSNVGVSPFKEADTVSVPGASCNTNNPDWWGVSNRYKTIGTPTAIAGPTNASSQETPTPLVVVDKSTMITCQKNGLYVQHTSDYASYAEVIFHGDVQEALAPHFSTQITVTALNPSSEASFIFGVRRQDQEENNEEAGYGDDHLIIRVDGSWQTTRSNDITDQDDATFSRGYVKPAHTMTLGAEVDGPRITFLVNNRQITTFVDTTFPQGYGIGFGLSDSEAKSSPSALYSNFSYQPLPGPTLTAQSALATATVQANKDLHATYTAARPGPDCDQGPGQWYPVISATASCRPHGFAMSQNATAKYDGFTSFYGLDGSLPTNYKVQVQIDTSQLSNGCAGLATRTDTQTAAYIFMVCFNGYWSIERFDSKGGNGHLLAKGFANQQTVYTMVATSNRAVQSLSLDGVTVSTIHDTTLKTTDHIELIMYAGQNTAGTALFSNFVFTPLS